MALEDLADFVREDFTDCGCPAEVLFGQEHVKEHTTSMRVVFLPSPNADKFEMPQQIQAAGPVPQSIADWQLGANPRAIRTRVVFGEARIWASGPTCIDPSYQRKVDQLAIDMLVNQTMLSMYRGAMGSITWLSGKQTQETINTNLGFVYVLSFTLEVPIVDVPWYYPGYINVATRTWPSVVIEQFVIHMKAQQQVTGNTMNGVTFVADGSNPDDQEGS